MSKCLVYSDLLLDDLCALEFLATKFDSITVVAINAQELTESDYASTMVATLNEAEIHLQFWFNSVRVIDGNEDYNLEEEYDLVLSLAQATRVVDDLERYDWLKDLPFGAMIGPDEEWNAARDLEAYHKLVEMGTHAVIVQAGWCEQQYEEAGYPIETTFQHEYISKMNSLGDSVCCYDLQAVSEILKRLGFE